MNGKTDALLLDFNDSFTYNIASELYDLGISTEVVAKNDILEKLSETIFSKKKTVIVYGPGPGHPDEYKIFFPLIKQALKNPNLYHLGICLGHQILWRVMGREVIPSKKPVHGQKIDFRVPSWSEFKRSFWGQKIAVQRYNSLIVKGDGEDFFKDFEGEVMAGRFEHGLSFQFHPESIGTANPKVFFESIKNFLVERN